jgi:pimeloyl-ACP methyl ester carboxylesterase
MKIVYIHGAKSTPKAFNFIKANLPKHEQVDVSYENNIPLIKIIEEIYNLLPDGPISIIAHSLGGVIAVALSQMNQVRNEKIIDKIFTMSSPFGGSRHADILRWLYPRHFLFADISTISPIVKAIKSNGAVIPTKCIITHGGPSPFIKEANDGVVSVESQLALRDAEIMPQNSNHFEVLLNADTIYEIKDFFKMGHLPIVP